MGELEEFAREIGRRQTQVVDAAIERALVMPGQWDVHAWSWLEQVDDEHLRAMTGYRLVPAEPTEGNWSPTVVYHPQGEVMPE